MGLSDSYLSAVETGRKPVNEDVVSRAIQYFTSLDGDFDGRSLHEAADMTRGSVSIAGLCPEASALMIRLSRHLPALAPADQLAESARILQLLDPKGGATSIEASINPEALVQSTEAVQ